MKNISGLDLTFLQKPSLLLWPVLSCLGYPIVDWHLKCFWEVTKNVIVSPIFQQQEIKTVATNMNPHNIWWLLKNKTYFNSISLTSFLDSISLVRKFLLTSITPAFKTLIKCTNLVTLLKCWCLLAFHTCKEYSKVDAIHSWKRIPGSVFINPL